MTSPSDDVTAPLAVLLGADGYQRVLALAALPPPEELLVPRAATRAANAEQEAARFPPLASRRFRLSREFVSRSHRWWRVYNNGRSRTPENGFVYLEVLPKS